MAKCGLQDRPPNYSIPKDKEATYFGHITRHTRGKPDPTKYSRPMSWVAPNGNFAKGGNRKTFTDEAQKHSAKIPCPSKYKNIRESRVLQGKIDLAEGTDYLSDCTYRGKMFPGPGSYKENPFAVKEKAREVKIAAP